MKTNCSLFGRIYISCQTRDGDLVAFFAHENQPFPVALSSNGDLRFGKKSALLPILEDLSQPTAHAPEVDVLLIAGSMVVQMLPPKSCKNFEDYALLIFIPYIDCQLRYCQRIDIVFDQYFTQSLKASMRNKRGQGKRYRSTFYSSS